MAILATDTLNLKNQCLLATTASGGTSPYKPPNRSKYSLHITLDNTDVVGTLVVRISNTTADADWITIASFAVTAAVDVNELVDLETSAAFCSLYFTRTSGGSAAQNFNITLHDVTR